MKEIWQIFRFLILCEQSSYIFCMFAWKFVKIVTLMSCQRTRKYVELFCWMTIVVTLLDFSSKKVFWMIHLKVWKFIYFPYFLTMKVKWFRACPIIRGIEQYNFLRATTRKSLNYPCRGCRVYVGFLGFIWFASSLPYP